MADTGEDRAITSDSDLGDAGDLAVLKARIGQLERENEELKRSAESEVVESAPAGRGRNAGAITLALIAALLLALAVPAVWLNRMVTDTDVYVETVAPLAEDPAIQDAVADAASAAVIERADSKSRLETVLPENLQILATPLSQAVDDFIRKQSLNLVRSDQFGSLWETVNRVSHKALVAAVTGRETGAVGVDAGTITLDVGTLADTLKGRLEDAGLGFVANLPTSSLDKQIVLYESPVLAQLTSTVDLVSRSAFIIPLIGFVLALGAIALAVDRRKAVLWLGGALAIAAILPLQALYLGQTYVVSQLEQAASIPAPAAQAAFEIVFRDLVTADRAAVALGVLLWAGAILAGPARWAVALRTGLSGGLGGMASHLELGSFGRWVRARKQGLRIAGIVGAVAVLFLLPAPRTVSALVWVAVGYVMWVVAVEFFGAEPVSIAEPDAVGDADVAEKPTPQARP